MRIFTRWTLTFVALSTAGTAGVDLLWQRSFAGESGTFLTDGEPADAAGASTFNILDFEVAGSAFPGHLGASYQETQPVQGFSWSGTEPTQFFRASGLFANHLQVTTVSPRSRDPRRGRAGGPVKERPPRALAAA